MNLGMGQKEGGKGLAAVPRAPRPSVPIPGSHALVVEVLAALVDLVLQGEVEGEVPDLLAGEEFGARGVLDVLQVLDHVREPNRQPVVAAG